MKLPQFQDYLRRKRIPLAVLMHPDPNITYFTQLKPSFAYLLITPRSAVLYLSKLDRRPSGLARDRIKAAYFSPGWQKKWLKALKGLGEKVPGKPRSKKPLIGINAGALTVQQLRGLRKLFGKFRMVDLSKFLGELRATKTPEEISRVSKACTITCAALQALQRELSAKQGSLKTERDVAEFLERQFRLRGAEPAFPTIAAMGKNAAVPHHVASTQKLGRGFLVVDTGACYRNYCADMTRVFFLGTPTRKEQELYSVLRRSQEKALSEISERKTFTALDAAARAVLGKYARHFTHSLGHGIGVEVHESPGFSGARECVRQNQVFTIEPGIYLPGRVGLRIEDTVLFSGRGRDGVRVLTAFPKNLIVVGNRPFR